VNIFFDNNSPQAIDLANKFSYLSSANFPFFVVVGGDGFMLEILRKNYEKTIPFFGINAGHYGFLLNEPELITNILENYKEQITIHRLPILDITMETIEGDTIQTVAFNDAYFERARGLPVKIKVTFNGSEKWIEATHGSTANIKIVINGKTKIEKIVSDGVLVATPSGSTAYARAMGAPIIPLDSNTLVLVGSNVAFPPNFKTVYLDDDTTIEFTNDNPLVRPLYGAIDGIQIPGIKKMTIKKKLDIDFQLALLKKRDLAEKLSEFQFPVAPIKF